MEKIVDIKNYYFSLSFFVKLSIARPGHAMLVVVSRVQCPMVAVGGNDRTPPPVSVTTHSSPLPSPAGSSLTEPQYSAFPPAQTAVSDNVGCRGSCSV